MAEEQNDKFGNRLRRRCRRWRAGLECLTSRDTFVTTLAKKITKTGI